VLDHAIEQAFSPRGDSERCKRRRAFLDKEFAVALGSNSFSGKKMFARDLQRAQLPRLQCRRYRGERMTGNGAGRSCQLPVQRFEIAPTKPLRMFGDLRQVNVSRSGMARV